MTLKANQIRGVGKEIRNFSFYLEECIRASGTLTSLGSFERIIHFEIKYSNSNNQGSENGSKRKQNESGKVRINQN